MGQRILSTPSIREARPAATITAEQVRAGACFFPNSFSKKPMCPPFPIRPKKEPAGSFFLCLLRYAPRAASMRDSAS